MVCVMRNVVFCEAGQFLTEEGQAVTVETSVMYLVRVMGLSDIDAGRACVFGDVEDTGIATTIGASLVIDDS